MQMMQKSVPVMGGARVGLLAGGEGGETLGSSIRERNSGVRVRTNLKSWGLNCGKSNGRTTKAWGSFIEQT